MSKLSQYFTGVAVKRLSEVEANSAVSNQHEFNGVNRMRAIFGDTRIEKMGTDILYLGEEEDESILDETFITWYDARIDDNSRSAEFRAYYTANRVMEKAQSGDLLVVAKRNGGRILIVVVRFGSTFEGQVLWLFGASGYNGGRVEISDVRGGGDREIGYAEMAILEALGVEPELESEDWLGCILEEFGERFPTTKLFSKFARDTAGEVSPIDDPDGTIINWLSHEEMLFRTLERHIVGQRLNTPFTDVDTFIKYSLSVQNRRKSRAGYSLEHHLREVFNAQELLFVEQVITEKNSKPDFLFPNLDSYHNLDFDAKYLTMLGAKSSCKERWNQVLAEAERIEDKHLFTLEASISSRQTDKMIDKKLQLVLPTAIHETYSDAQQEWLMDLGGFIEEVKERQKSAGL
jgi:hypothetical protein